MQTPNLNLCIDPIYYATVLELTPPCEFRTNPVSYNKHRSEHLGSIKEPLVACRTLGARHIYTVPILRHELTLWNPDENYKGMVIIP